MQAARAGQDLDPALTRRVRVIEYEIPDRSDGSELIALVTTITGAGRTRKSGRTQPDQSRQAEGPLQAPGLDGGVRLAARGRIFGGSYLR